MDYTQDSKNVSSISFSTVYAQSLTRIACGASGVIMGLWQGRTIQSDFSLSSLYQVTWHTDTQAQQSNRCKRETIARQAGD